MHFDAYCPFVFSAFKDAFTKALPFHPDYAWAGEVVCAPHRVTDLSLLLQLMGGVAEPHHKPMYVRLPDWPSHRQALSDVLQTLVFFKYVENTQADSLQACLKTGTVLLHPDKSKAYVVVGKDAQGYKLRAVKESNKRAEDRKGKRIDECKASNTISDLPFHKAQRYIPLANVTEKEYKSTWPAQLYDYFEELNKSLLGCRPTTVFKNRLLLVAPEEAIKALKQHRLPIRYNFIKHDKVPVEWPLVEVVSSYEEVRKYICNEAEWEESKEEERKSVHLYRFIQDVVVLGDRYLRQDIGLLERDLTDGRLRRVLVVGSALPAPRQKGFRYWLWSLSERLQLTGHHAWKPIALTDNDLITYASFLNEFADSLGPEQAVKTRAILLHFLNHHLRDACLEVDALLAYQRQQLQDRGHELYACYENSGIKLNYEQWLEQVLEVLAEAGHHACQQQAKLMALKDLAATGEPLLIITKGNRQIEALSQCFAGQPHVEVLAYAKLAKRLRNEQPGEKLRFAVPCLHLHFEENESLLKWYRVLKLALRYGEVNLLYFSEVEENRQRFFEERFLSEENFCLTHPDRSQWVSESCEPLVPVQNAPATALSEQEEELLTSGLPTQQTTPPEQQPEHLRHLNEVLTRHYGLWHNPRRPPRCRDEDGRPVASEKDEDRTDRRRFEVNFKNGGSMTCSSRQYMARWENGQWQQVRPGELRPNDKVLHFDISFRNALEPLQQLPDAREPLAEIKAASQQWRQWLQEDIGQPPSQAATEACYHRIQKRLEQQQNTFVALDTFCSWPDKHAYFFPRENLHLETLMAVCLERMPPEKQAEAAARQKQVLAARDDKNGRFKELVTRLNSELVGYEVCKTKGELLSLLEADHLDTLLRQRKDLHIDCIEELP